MALEDEKYVLLTTFRRDGRAVSTPVWLVPLGAGEFGFSTGDASGKVKRLRHTSQVTVQGCDSRGGDLHGPVYAAAARLVSGDELSQVRAAIFAKYGVMARGLRVAEVIARALGVKRFGSPRVGVVITPTGELTG